MILRLLIYLTFALLTTRRSTRSNNHMATDNTIFADRPDNDERGDVTRTDEHPILAREPEDQLDVFLNYRLAQQPNGHRALRVWANGQYIDITAAQADLLRTLLGPAAVDLADIRQDIGGES